MNTEGLQIVMLVSSDLDTDPRVQKEARAAFSAGHRVTVVCRHSSLEHPFRVIPLESEKTRFRNAITRLLDRVQFSFRAIAHAPRGVDIVHANDLDMLPVGWILAKKTRAALVYDSHESWTDISRGIPDPMLKAVRWMEGALSRRADAVVTVSDPIADHLSRAYRIDRPTVVMNAPEFFDIKSVRQAPNAVDKPGRVQGQGRLVLFHGIYRSNSGLEQLLRAAPFLPEDVSIGLRGYGPYEKRLRALAEGSDVGARIRFLPPVPMAQLVESASSADLGVIPLLPETRQNLGASPNKLFEYLMAGLPIVTSRIPTIEAIVSSFDVGLSFDIYDPQDVASRIVEALEPTVHGRMRQNALSAARVLNWENEYPKLEATYRRVAGGPSWSGSSGDSS